MTVNALATVENDPPLPIKDDEPKVIPFTPLRSAVDIRQAFTEEIKTHHRDLLVYARSIVFDKDQARDLVQEACLTAWSKIANFDSERADFGAWIRGILRNKIRDWVKSKKGAQRPEVTMEAEHLDLLEEHFSEPHKQPSFSRLKSCLKKLPIDLQRPIQLTYYQGHKGEEASNELGIQPATLRKRLSRARLALHDCLTQLA